MPLPGPVVMCGWHSEPRAIQGQLQIPESSQVVPGGLSNWTALYTTDDMEGSPHSRRENDRRHGKSGNILIKSQGSGGRLDIFESWLYYICVNLGKLLISLLLSFFIFKRDY